MISNNDIKHWNLKIETLKMEQKSMVEKQVLLK